MPLARYARIVCLDDINNVPNSAAGEFTFLTTGGTPLTNTGWTIVADSQETPTYASSFAFDGATGPDFWHTQFSGGEPGHPHFIDIDFGSSLTVEKLQYAGRSSGANGNVARVQVFLSATPNFTEVMHAPVVADDFAHANNPTSTFGSLPTANTTGVQFVAARRKRDGSGDSTVTIPPGVQAGDYAVLLIWELGSNSGPTLSGDASGMSLLHRVDGTGFYTAAYGKFLTGSETSWGVAHNGYTDYAVLFYRNVDTTTPLQTAADGTGTGTSAIAPAVTATQANSLLIATCTGTTTGFCNSSGCTVPGSMVLRIADFDSTIEAMDELLASSGSTGTRTIAMGNSQDWLAMSLLLNPAGAGGGGGGGYQPTSKLADTDRDFLLESKVGRLFAVAALIAAQVGNTATPGLRRPPSSDTLEDRAALSRRVIPSSVDKPPIKPLRSSVFETVEDRATGPRRVIPSSVDQPPVKPLRSQAFETVEDRAPASRRVIPSSVDKPPTARWRAAVADFPADWPQSASKSVATWLAPVGQLPPQAIRRSVFGESLSDISSRARLVTPDSVDVPTIITLRRSSGELLPDRSIDGRRVTPDSVDQPSFGPRRAVSDTSCADVVQTSRRLVILLAPSQVDQPPAPRWRTVSDTPGTDILSARLRLVLPSGAVVVPDQPLARWRTAGEPLPEENRIRLLVRLPESVDQPVLGVWEVPSEIEPEQAPFRRAATPPVTNVADQPPQRRWCTISDTDLVDLRPRLLWRAPESVDSPPLVRARQSQETTPDELRSRLEPSLAWYSASDAPTAVRWRSAFDTPSEQLPIRQLRRLPESFVPSPVDDPQPHRWATISDTPLEELPVRHLRVVLQSGVAQVDYRDVVSVSFVQYATPRSTFTFTVMKPTSRIT